MKNILGVVLAAVAIIAVVAPYAIGYQAEKSFRQYVADVSQRLDKQLSDDDSVEITDYQRGYLSSTATTRVRINGETFKIKHDIAHGPYGVFGLARVDSKPEIPEKIQKQVADVFEGPALEATTRIGFGGDYTIRLHSSPFQHPIEADDKRIDWGGLDATYQKAGDRVSVSLTLPKWVIRTDQRDLTLADVEMSAEHPGSRWNNQYNVSVDQFSVAEKDGAQLRGELRLQGQQKATPDQEQVSSHNQWSVNNLKLQPADATDAGDVQIDQAKLNIDLTGLDAEGLERFATAVRDVRDDNIARGLSSEQAGRQMLRMAQRYVPGLVTADSVIKLTVPTLTMPAGDAKASLRVSLAGDDQPQMNPSRLLKRLEAKLNAAADARLVKQTMRRSMPRRSVQPQLTMLRSRNILKRDGDRLQIAYRYQDGSSTLNGQPAPDLASSLMRNAR